MNLYLLIPEILLDVFTLALGIILFFKAKDNRFRRVWGALSVLLASVLLYDNIGWLCYSEMKASEEPIYLFSISRMLKWYFLAHVFSLFPIASLRPGWFTPFRLVIFWFPPLLVGAIALSYMWFDGYSTPVHSVGAIFCNIGKLDIQIRLGIFIASIVTPAINFLIPFLGKERLYRRRRWTSGMYLYVCCSALVTVMYVLFTLNTTPWIFDLYGYVVMLLPVSISILCYRTENPLSAPPETDEVNFWGGELEVSPAVYELYLKMWELMRAEAPYVSSTYTIRQLSARLSTKQKLLVKAIRYAGFTGFQEYIDFLRLEYFKNLAVLSPDTPVCELMDQSGFVSSSKFYRYFNEQEKMSPEEFMDLSR